MSEILLRVPLHNPQQAHAAISGEAWPFVKEHTSAGRELVAEIRLLDDAITEAQRGYLHGVVLTEIAAFARPNGQQFPMPVWKEFFRDKFLGFKVHTCINPLTGRKSRRRVRVSTEDLGVRAYAIYIDKVIAYAATELGVEVSEPQDPDVRAAQQRHVKRIGHTKKTTIDAETGEILEAA